MIQQRVFLHTLSVASEECRHTPELGAIVYNYIHLALWRDGGGAAAEKQRKTGPRNSVA